MTLIPNKGRRGWVWGRPKTGLRGRHQEPFGGGWERLGRFEVTQRKCCWREASGVACPVGESLHPATMGDLFPERDAAVYGFDLQDPAVADVVEHPGAACSELLIYQCPSHWTVC
jgi:hypothetical protein